MCICTAWYSFVYRDGRTAGTLHVACFFSLHNYNTWYCRPGADWLLVTDPNNDLRWNPKRLRRQLCPCARAQCHYPLLCEVIIYVELEPMLRKAHHQCTPIPTSDRTLDLISIFFPPVKLGEAGHVTRRQPIRPYGAVFRPTSSVNDLNYHCNRKFQIFSNLTGQPGSLVIYCHFICYDISTVFPLLITLPRLACLSDKAKLVNHPGWNPN